MDIRYLAGIFDGEGCAYMKRNRESPRIFIMKISQKDTRLLYAIREVYEGRVESGGKRGTPRWVLSGNKAKTIALQMFPYLIVKKNTIKSLLGVVHSNNS